MIKVWNLKMSPVVILSLLILTCPVTPVEAEGSYEVRDFTGKTLLFKASPGRIVSTAPSITEILFSLGSGSHVVGVTNNCNYPPETAPLPRIGDIHLDMERIIELAPDLVVLEESLNIESAPQMEKLGLKILTLNCSSFDNLEKSLMILGQALRKEDNAAILRLDLEKRVKSIVGRIPSNGQKVSVFVEIWDKPIITAGSDTLFDELIRLAGGQNVYGSAGKGYPRVSLESLIKMDPEVIILTTSKRAEVMERSAWKGLSAVRTGRIFDINPDIIARPTLRMAEALEILALWLHPEIRSKSMNFSCTKRYGPSREVSGK